LERDAGLDTLLLSLLPASIQLSMQYTLRKIPKAVDAALRLRARRAGKTLNQVAVEAMIEGLDLGIQSPPRRSVRDLLGAGSKDPELEEALASQRQVDPELWR
jgi:hypothetical protein